MKKKKEQFLGRLNLEMATVKDFISPITTKPWGKFIPKVG